VKDGPNFVVSCKTCGRKLLTTRRVAAVEAAIIEAHLRACYPVVPLDPDPMLGQLMPSIRVARMKTSGGGC
jgi:hypothetical protein